MDHHHPWNDTLIHCYGDIILVSFSHINSQRSAAFRILVSQAPLDRLSQTGRSTRRIACQITSILFGIGWLIQYSFDRNPVAFGYGVSASRHHEEFRYFLSPGIEVLGSETVKHGIAAAIER
jgi:hypothetical protein